MRLLAKLQKFYPIGQHFIHLNIQKLVLKTKVLKANQKSHKIFNHSTPVIQKRTLIYVKKWIGTIQKTDRNHLALLCTSLLLLDEHINLF